MSAVKTDINAMKRAGDAGKIGLKSRMYTYWLSHGLEDDTGTNENVNV